MASHLLVPLPQQMSKEIFDRVEEFILVPVELKLLSVGTFSDVHADQFNKIDHQLDPVEWKSFGGFRLLKLIEVIIFDQRRPVLVFDGNAAQVMFDEVEQKIEQNIQYQPVLVTVRTVITIGLVLRMVVRGQFDQ